MNFIVIGSGFSGAVLARQLVDSLDCQVEIWDERSHIAGNCHTLRDSQTNVMVHKYGPHIFNTDNERVWSYVTHFGEFKPFVNRVKASTSRGVFSLPINLLTINQFFGKSMSPQEAQLFVASLGDPSIKHPRNFEEQALHLLGSELYETFFKGYTIKQWGCDPTSLPASILKRLPIRFNYDDSYYNKKYQAIPATGYSAVIQSILDHPRIVVRLNKKYSTSMFPNLHSSFDHLFYTGPLDAFFDYSEGPLGYRTVTFERIATELEDYQGNAVINYPDLSVPWTRIHEHKHFAPWETHTKTAVFREYSKETGREDIPYYPKRLPSDIDILFRYRKMAEDRFAGSSSKPAQMRASFLGRLATYRYMDMEAVIGEALDFSDQFVASRRNKSTPPIFPNKEA